MSEIKVVILTPTGWTPAKIEDSLRSYQRIVGGLIEAVDYLTDRYHGFANEEGILLSHPPNMPATQMWAASLGYKPNDLFPTVLHGNVILVGSGSNGKNLDVPSNVATIVEGFYQ